METYERIKQLCIANGTTVTALEMSIGFSRGSIGKMKKGVKTTPERLQIIADYFGVSVAYLIGETTDGFNVSGETADTIQAALSRREIMDLLEAAIEADAEDVRAVTYLLKRIGGASHAES